MLLLLVELAVVQIENTPVETPQAELSQTELPQPPLNLTCFGGGTANKSTSSTVSTGSGLATIRHRRQQNFDEQVDIRLFNGDDRIRIPKAMLTWLRGGENGWFKLKNVIADARTIRAKAAVSFISNPDVYIDRVTGTISISGRAGEFAGQCEVLETDAPAKF